MREEKIASILRKEFLLSWHRVNFVPNNQNVDSKTAICGPGGGNSTLPLIFFLFIQIMTLKILYDVH